MARQKTDIIEANAAPVLDQSKFDEITAKSNELIALQAEDKSNAAALAAQFGYTGPIDPDSLERVCQIRAAAAAHSIFEFGAALVLLRESCLHGDWMRRFEGMAISRRTAHNYMTIALRFKDTDVRSTLVGLGVNKMLEMAALDDEEIKELTTDGTLHGHVVGDIDRMSVKDMKKKIAELQAEKTATEQLLSSKNAKIDQLSRKGAKFSFSKEWPAQVDAAVEVVDKYSRDSEQFLDVVMQACTQAMGNAPTDEAEQQVFAQGAAALAARVRDAMARQREVMELADAHFLATLGAYLED